MRSMQNQNNVRLQNPYGFGRIGYEQIRSGSCPGRHSLGREPLRRSLPLGGQSCPLSGRSADHTDVRATNNARRTTCNGRTACMNRDKDMPARQNNIPSIEEGCGCDCGNGGNDCAKLMKQLQTVDFALYEVILYLDAYPEDCEALNTYHMLLARRRKLAAAYEETCGPLTAWGNVNTASWDWVKGPAPWEYPVD